MIDETTDRMGRKVLNTIFSIIDQQKPYLVDVRFIETADSVTLLKALCEILFFYEIDWN